MDDKYKKEYEKQRKQFRNHRQDNWNKGATGAISYDPTYHEQPLKVKKPKPDPATVEAALRLEEELWAS